jgi:hypothetical protein
MVVCFRRTKAGSDAPVGIQTHLNQPLVTAMTLLHMSPAQEHQTLVMQVCISITLQLQLIVPMMPWPPLLLVLPA